MAKKKKDKLKKPVILSGAKKSLKQEQSFRWIYIFLFLFACGLYINTATHDFAFDDSVVITGNKYTKQGFDGIKTLVTKDLFYGIYGNALDLEGGRWRPLTLAMFAIEYQFFGNNATSYHLMNIVLYGITAIVLFITLLEMFFSYQHDNRRGTILAFITTLLFIAHPIHTEVVANIKSRDEILSFLFLCLSLLFLFRAVKTNSSPTGGKLPSITGKGRGWGLAVLCYFTALLSKENGITFIAIIPLALFFFAKKNIKQCLLFTIPFFITAGIYLAMRTSLVGMIGDRQSNDLTDNPFLTVNFPNLPVPVPLINKLATVSWILMKYIFLLIFPHPLSCDYGFNQIPVVSFSNPKALVSLLIYAVLIFYAVKVLLKEIKSRKNPGTGTQKPEQLLFSFSILYFLITISIVSNLFFLIGTTMGERFAYTSSLGFCLAVGVLFCPGHKGSNDIRSFFILSRSVGVETKRGPLGAGRGIILLAIFIPFSYKTITRNRVWKNNQTLFSSNVKTASHSATAHYYYANTLFTEHLNDEQSPKRDSLFAEAKKEFNKSLEINPYFHYCYYNIGLIFEKFNQPDSAIVWQTKVINLKPENSMAQYMAKGALGLVYGKLKGDADKAIPLLKEALANKPDDTGYHENLGICYAMKSDFDNSIKEFETALRLKSQLKKEDARVFMNLALSWQNKGNKEKADEYFQKAFQLDPGLKK